VQMEMAWSSYLDESCPQRWDPVRADAAQRLLKGLLESLAQWRPD
jgi:N-formylglutamate amidohydrolase